MTRKLGCIIVKMLYGKLINCSAYQGIKIAANKGWSCGSWRFVQWQHLGRLSWADYCHSEASQCYRETLSRGPGLCCCSPLSQAADFSACSQPSSSTEPRWPMKTPFAYSTSSSPPSSLSNVCSKSWLLGFWYVGPEGSSGWREYTGLRVREVCALGPKTSSPAKVYTRPAQPHADLGVAGRSNPDLPWVSGVWIQLSSR